MIFIRLTSSLRPLRLFLMVSWESGQTPSGMRVVGTPHDVVFTNEVDHVSGEGFLLEGGIALASPVIAGNHRERGVALILVVHAVEDVGNPGNAAFTKDKLEVGESFAGA